MNIVRTKIVSVFFGVIVVVILLIYAILNVGLSSETYKEIQLEYAIAEYAGSSQVTLDDATETLINYIKGDREDLSVTGIVFNVETEIFNEREKAHMVDVKNLIILAQHLLNVGIALLIVIFIMEITTNREAFNYKFFKGVSATMIITLLAILLIGAYALIDFNAFWSSFHKVFFTNDLYLLDPNTDFLIRMMPLQFFIAIVTKLGSIFFHGYIISLASMISCHYILKGSKSK